MRSSLVKYHLPLLSFGLLLTFFSSFGQTFLLSLYVPAIAEFLELSNTAFGSLYAVATVGSALLLPLVGGYFDRMALRSYALLVVLGLTVALLLLSVSHHIVMVAVAFFLLRLFGQGLMGHTAISAMARYFGKNRGKAIGVATLGYPAGEAVLPLIVALVIGAMGWRVALQLSALTCVVIVAPLVVYLVRRSRVSLRAYEIREKPRTKVLEKFPVGRIVRDKRFWIIAPLVFVLGFVNTALFFFQLRLGEARGWTPEWVAGSLAAFAAASAFGMVGSGPLVDRFSGRRLFRMFLWPYVAGLVLLASLDHALVYPASLLLLGISNGAGSTIKNAMLAEVYGTDVIGRIRSVFTMVMVFSTALGPVTFGVLLDTGWDFTAIFSAAAVMVLLALLNSRRRLTT